MISESERTDAKNCFYPIIVKDNKIVALYDSVWSDDFKTTQYEMTLDFNKIGCKIYKLISQIKKEGDTFKYL